MMAEYMDADDDDPRWHDATNGHWDDSYDPADSTPPPLFDLDAGRIDGFLSPPPARRWLLKDLLPLGVVGLLAAGGGTGKTILMLQLAVAVAAGIKFLGITVDEPGGVLVLAGEDERDELHRRLFRIVYALRQSSDWTSYNEALLRKRLFIVSRVGMDNRLTRIGADGEIERTSVGAQIAAVAALMPSCVLIVLDPVSRFRGGEENSNDHATRFVEAVEALRGATGANVLLPHHVTKDGMRAGAERLSADGLRGASALLDGVRWAAAMGTMSKDAAPDYGIDPAEAGNYVRLDAVKNNYAAPWPGMWLQRTSGGVLIPAQIARSTEARAERRGEERYQAALPKLVDLVRLKPMTQRQILAYAGVEGVFGLGINALRSVVHRALEEGHIRERDKGIITG